VPKFLQAADMGILLRKKDPLNEVAAPTKFAEYMMTGLPTLISKNQRLRMFSLRFPERFKHVT